MRLLRFWELWEKPSLDSGYLSETQLRRMGFSHVGNNVRIARNCTVIGAENISLGRNVRIDGFTTIIAAGGHMSVGDFVHIGGACHINASHGFAIDDFSTLSQGVRIYSASDDFSGTAMTNSMVPAEFKHVKVGPVKIGRHCVVGAGSIVLPGCRLGEGVAIGALSLVNRDLEEWKIYAGSPARIIRDRDRGALDLGQKLLEKYV